MIFEVLQRTSSLSVDVMSPSNKLKLRKQCDIKNASDSHCHVRFSLINHVTAITTGLLLTFLNQCLTLNDVFYNSSIKFSSQIQNH